MGGTLSFNSTVNQLLNITMHTGYVVMNKNDIIFISKSIYSDERRQSFKKLTQKQCKVTYCAKYHEKKTNRET